jgi:hypothetical protein
MRIKPGPPQRKFVSESNKEWGEIPATKVVVVTQRNQMSQPNSARRYT